MSESSTLLEVKDLHVAVHARGHSREVVRGVSFKLGRGGTLGIVGESGSGKTLATLSILRLLPAAARIAAGTILFKGLDLTRASPKLLTELRGKDIGVVGQDSLSSLNPVMRIGKQVREPLLLHGLAGAKEAEAKAIEELRRLGLADPARLMHGYPHEFSGGMRQRAMIATAMIAAPSLIIADEPTTALDATVQAQIIEIWSRLNREMGVALILVSHDLGVVAEVCDQIAVMYAGRIVEMGDSRAIMQRPRHPYTEALLESIPTRSVPRGAQLKAIPGEPPSVESLPPGCPFSTRCRYVMDVCRTTEPPLVRTAAGEAACWAIQEAPVGAAKPAASAAVKPEPSPMLHPEAGDRQEPGEELLRAEAITRHHRLSGGLPFARPLHLHALDDVSLSINRGEVLGIAGESGCGKSTLAKCLLRLSDVDSGHIFYRGKDITRAEGEELRRLRRHIQPVFQDPYGSLNPRLRVRRLVEDPLIAHGVASEERERRVHEALELVGLSRRYADRLPHELSGGQRQRVGIARAIVLNPELIIADEPLSALDVSVQAQVLNLLQSLQRRTALALIFISHDLRIVRYLSTRVAIMFLGKIVEYGPSEEVCGAPLHPYTVALLSSVPEIEQSGAARRTVLRGEPPSPVSPPSGCRFRTRCPYAAPICAEVPPELVPGPGGRTVACHFPGIASGESPTLAGYEPARNAVLPA